MIDCSSDETGHTTTNTRSSKRQYRDALVSASPNSASISKASWPMPVTTEGLQLRVQAANHDVVDQD